MPSLGLHQLSLEEAYQQLLQHPLRVHKPVGDSRKIRQGKESTGIVKLNEIVPHDEKIPPTTVRDVNRDVAGAFMGNKVSVLVKQSKPPKI